VGHGVYRRADAPGDPQNLLAWQQVLSPTACFTHLTAAAEHGLWLPPLPPDLPAFVSQSDRDPRPKRPEIRAMRHTKPISYTWVGGVRLASVEETLLVCARHLALLDLVVLGDSALHLGLTSRTQLIEISGHRRWGASRMARAVDWMDGRAESPWESLLRVLHRACGVPVVPQHEVFDERGRFVARGDLWIQGSRMLHEYDGAGHHEATEYARGLDRDRRLLDVDWRRRGYTAPDLMVRPEGILKDADATLGRRHRVDRLDTWLAMHRESLFHQEGQAALLLRLGMPNSGRELQPWGH